MHIFLIDGLIYPRECIFSIKGHVALDHNSALGYDTLLLQWIAGDLLSTCSKRKFQTLPCLLDSQAALSNSYPYTCVPSRETDCTFYMMLFGMTPLAWDSESTTPTQCIFSMYPCMSLCYITYGCLLSGPLTRLFKNGLPPLFFNGVIGNIVIFENYLNI